MPGWCRLRLVAFLAALAITGIGIWLIVDKWVPKLVAGAFTRVGGETRIETALEASSLWREPPRGVVTIPGRGSS